MLTTILRKTGWMILTLLVIVTVVFVMVRLSGVDPCLRLKATPQAIEACHEKWGLNDPLVVQYANYMSNLIRFDFGESYRHVGMSVTEIIAQSIPNTLMLVLLAIPLAFLIGSFAGIVAALRRNTKTDYTVMGVALVGVAVPEFVLGPILILVVSMKLEWIPRTEGLHSVESLILPVITLAFPLMAAIARLARVGMLEQLGQDYIRTAKAKGLSDRRVILHALRLGLIPVLSYMGPAVAFMMAGHTFVVETLFGISGIGLQFVQASISTPIDYPMIMGATTVLAGLILIMNLGVDICYAVLDPRQRTSHQQNKATAPISWRNALKALAIMVGAVVAIIVVIRLSVFIGRSLSKTEIAGWFTDNLPLILSFLWIGIGAAILRSFLRARKGRSGASATADAWRRLAKHRAAMVSLVVLYGIVFLCLFGPCVWEFCFGITYDFSDLDNTTRAPSFMKFFGSENAAVGPHLFGTDIQGRDVLVRTLVGGRISLAIGLAALLVTSIIGVFYGTIAAYFGGRIDNIMMRLVDIMYSIPYLILVILLVAFLGRSIILLFIAIGCVSWLTLARITRGEVLTIREKEFVEAAETTGASAWHVIRRHLIPNALGPIIIYGTRLVALIVIEEAFLSFLGFGVQEPMSSWGLLIRSGNEVKEFYPWLLAFPCLFLTTTIFALNYAGDGLRDALDPRLRGSD